jgi:hypothetical protein
VSGIAGSKGLKSQPKQSVSQVRIVGSGLIGTSIGLGLVQHGIHVEMVDSDPKTQSLASDLIGSKAIKSPEVVILALPTRHLEDPSQIENILLQGRTGRELIPGKHGGKAREYSHLPIVIDDKPGQLAAIFNECSTLGVNVEDLIIEHSPGQLSALITLALSAPDARKLSDHLGSIGWNVHPIRN